MLAPLAPIARPAGVMDPRAEQVWEKLRPLPADQRAAVLRKICGDEPGLLADVEALFAAAAARDAAESPGASSRPPPRAPQPA